MQRSTMGPSDVDDFDPPSAPDVLPNIPGGQDNLLPLSALARPLRIEIPMWEFSLPSPEHPEWIILYWNDQPVAQKTWYETIPPDDLYVEVPVEFLNHGQVTVTYLFHGYNEAEVCSLPLSLTVDKVAPVLGGSQGSLIFDEEVVENGVTVRYLELNEDRLLAQVPDYDRPAVADTLIFYWDREPFADEEVAQRVLTEADLGEPIIIEFSGDMIRERGDGSRYVHYTVRDRAGNHSAGSRPVRLEVDATPIPRSLTPVLIEQAEGSGAQQTLVLDDFFAPLLVEVPAEAVIYPDETLTVVWGEPGSFGYYSTSTLYNGRERHFEIPVQKVMAQSKRTLAVIYQVSDGKTTLDSDTLSLQVRALTQRLPQPQLKGADSTGFDLGPAPANVPVKLGTWPMIAVGQQVSIQLTGVLQNGNEAPAYDVLVAHPVSATEVNDGIGARDNVTVPKTYLASLKINERFTIGVQVSFDEGENWVKFPSINLTLRA